MHEMKEGWTFREYFVQLQRTLWLYISFCLVNCIGAYLAGKTHIVLGLLAGTATGVIYFLMIGRRIQKSIDLPAAKAMWYMRVGWIVRFAFVLMIFIITLHYPTIDFIAAVTGFLLLHVVILFNAIWIALSLKRIGSKEE